MVLKAIYNWIYTIQSEGEKSQHLSSPFLKNRLVLWDIAEYVLMVMVATNVKLSRDQGLECTLLLLQIHWEKNVFKRYEKRKCESFTDRGMECCLMLVLWNDKMALQAVRVPHLTYFVKF